MATLKHLANVNQTDAEDEMVGFPAHLAASRLAHMGVVGHA